MSQYISFKIDDNLIGLDIYHLREINRVLEITPVQHAPRYVKGLINLRGKTVTVFDLGIRLGLKERVLTSETMNIILKASDVGLLVDAIGDLIEANDDEIEAPPANFKGIDIRFIQGVYKMKDCLLVILSSDKLLNFQCEKG